MHRLDAEENGRFRAVYCGLCHALGKRYGFAARFLLNYDFTLLAILLSSAMPPICACRRCIAHPRMGCAAMDETAALDISADYSVVLFWWQLRDQIADHGLIKGLNYRLAAFFLRGAYRKARRNAPDFDAAVQRHLRDLSDRERGHCASLDMAADPFAALLAEAAEAEGDEVRRRVLRQLFYHLGRWIYLIDAADDFKKDAASGNYNPLRWRYAVDGDELPEYVKRALGETLDTSIRRMASAYALLDYGVWTPLLDSIFYESLYGIGNAVLEGTYHKRTRLRRGSGMSEGTI